MGNVTSAYIRVHKNIKSKSNMHCMLQIYGSVHNMYDRKHLPYTMYMFHSNCYMMAHEILPIWKYIIHVGDVLIGDSAW